jgi:hypothetical protein
MALRICKEPVSEVQAWGLRGETKAYSSVTAKYLFGDIPFVSTASWTGLYKRRCTLITGEVGTILFDDRAEKKLTLFKKDGMSYPSYSDELPLVSEMTAFLQMIRSKVVDASQLQTGLAVVRLIACAEASAQNGGKSVSC